MFYYVIVVIFTVLDISYGCLSGNYINNGTCTPCEKGFFCPNDNMTAPFPCPLGTYSNNTGFIQCKDCPAGYFCNETVSGPKKCSPGFYSKQRMSICIPCPSGYR